jgi:hypothetical protein
MKHTPGPWVWDGVDESYGSFEAEVLKGANGDLVIRLEDDYPGYPECGEHLIMDMNSEDARLIAAAPELLEALKQLNSALNFSDPIKYNEKITFSGMFLDACNKAFVVALSAIAKAEGTNDGTLDSSEPGGVRDGR